VAARPRLVVTSGDPGGIGPELVRRALAEPGVRDLAEYTVTGPVDGADGVSAAAAVPVARPAARTGWDVAEAGLAVAAFSGMYQHPFGSQLMVGPGRGGAVKPKPGPEVITGGPGGAGG
jgi:hypothetical protein